MRIHRDSDVLALPPQVVVETMRDAIRAHARGDLQAPPRATVPIDEGRMVFTVGGVAGDVIGFRAYGVGTDAGEDQIVVAWKDERLDAVITGEQLGIRRTAGIGAVATDVLAPRDARTLGLVGAGRQARAHVREVGAVRDLDVVRVFSRTTERREATAAWIESTLGVTALPTESAEDAAAHADLVTLATTSFEPVVDAAAVADGAHVATIGPKLRDRHELPLELAQRAAIIATDSLEQVHAYDPPFFLSGTPQLDRVVELGDLLESGAPPQHPGDLTLFCSVGLAGTEPLLARAVVRQAP